MAISVELAVETKGYPIDAFRSELLGICGAFAVEPTARGRDDLHRDDLHRDDLRGHLSLARFGGVDLAKVGQDAGHISRTSRDIRSDPGSHFFLIMQHQGRAHLTQGDVSTWVEPGGMFVVDSTMTTRLSTRSSSVPPCRSSDMAISTR